MPVTQALQAPGRWDISLDGGRLPPPRAVTDMLAIEEYGFSHICITPTWIDPSTVDRAGMLAASRYTGRYRTQQDRLTLTGDHATAWLGDGDGKGLVIGAPWGPNAYGFFTWIDQSLGAAQPISQGFVNNTRPGTLTWTWPQGMSWRDAYDYICKHFNCEWRVTNSLSLDAGILSDLYVSIPRVICTPWWDGADGEYEGMRSTIGLTRSLEKYVATIEAFNASLSQASNGPILYYDGFGQPAQIIRSIEANEVANAAGLLALAQAEGRADFAHRDLLRIETDHFCPLQHLTPGDYIGVWDPENRVYGLGPEEVLLAFGAQYETHYGGHICWPTKTRVFSVTMKVRQGMGVYFVRGVDGAIIDLTDYVAWETGMSTLDVGADPRRLTSSVRRTAVGS